MIRSLSAPLSAPPRIVALSALVLLGSGMLGCAPQPEPTPTPTAAFSSEEEAFAAAEEVYRAYIDASNSVDLEDPKTFESLEQYTAGDYQVSEREELTDLHAEHVIQEGAIVISKFSGADSDLTSFVSAIACNDVRDLELIDEAGESLVPSNRPAIYQLDLRFMIRGVDVWLVQAEAAEGDTCTS